MFLIGDGIFYPMFGAGHIVNIEEKEIYGIIKKYYIIKLISSGMLVMIPMDSEDSKRLRKIITKNDYSKIIQIIQAPYNILPQKWIDRIKKYNECIKEGNIYKLSEMARDIYYLPRRKEVSKSDIKTFDDILGMIASELSIVIELSYEETKVIMLGYLKNKP